MFRVETKIIFFLLSFCVACRADDLSPGDVFDLLSRRIDDVIVETRSIKSELVETKLAVSKIENKIENIEETIANIATSTDFEEKIESNIKQEIKTFKDIAKSEVHEKLNRQKAVVQKMLSIEKTLLRDKIEQFDQKTSTFEADLNSKLTQMNETMEQFVDHLNEINDEHKLDTNFSIMFLKTDFELMLKDEDLKIEELIERTEKKIEKTKTEITNSTDTNLQEIREAIDETAKSLKKEINEQYDDENARFENDIKSKIDMLNVTMDELKENLNESLHEIRFKTFLSFIVQNKLYQSSFKKEAIKIEEMNVSIHDVINSTEKRIEAAKTEITHLTNTNLQDMKETIDKTSNSLKKEIRDVSETVSNRNTELQNAISRVSNRMNNAESRLSSAESADRQLSSNLNTLERNQNTKDSNLDSRISQLSSRVSKEEARKVAFSARQSKADNYYFKDEKIVFDYVIYSYGGGYSSSTGIFTATKSGTYLFTFNIQASNKGKAHVLLMIDGTSTTRTIAKGYDDNGGNAAVYYLSEGDKAFVQTASLEDRYYIHPYRTTFNGVLID